MISPRTNDAKLIGLNAVGLSLARIGRDLVVHHTTVTQRLRQLGVAPGDTRRAFMEDIWDSLTEPQREWLIARLGAGQTIKDFVRSLIVNEFIRSNQK
jgi:carbonic anhydrase/acetyltransferase-like protein (isoleucine patch superfamily)